MPLREIVGKPVKLRRGRWMKLSCGHYMRIENLSCDASGQPWMWQECELCEDPLPEPLPPKDEPPPVPVKEEPLPVEAWTPNWKDTDPGVSGEIRTYEGRKEFYWRGRWRPWEGRLR